ncbi:MAG: hypothetical protein JWO42_3412 [Chloroflexi bacterium]|nr:hypothetical protein [Chloroflexota bacterium]
MPDVLLSSTRNGVVERRERGHCVIADSRGTVIWSVGDADHVTYLRSSAKPMQATALVLTGAVERYGLADDNISVACGSHRGEPRHVKTALHTLQSAGVPAEALGCGTHDLYSAEGTRLAAAGLAPTPLHNNCSGKHAGMLAASSASGASLESYLDPAHPVQRMIHSVVSECSGISPQALHVGVDGCSAPNFAMPMRNIARCFANIANPSGLPSEVGAALSRTGTAMQRDPWLVSGTGEFDTLLMGELPGMVISKAGAEGLQCVAVPSLGIGIAVKFESGRSEGIGYIMLSILTALGAVDDIPGPLRKYDYPPVLNHRRIKVGETRHHLDEPLSALTALKLAQA